MKTTCYTKPEKYNLKPSNIDTKTDELNKHTKRLELAHKFIRKHGTKGKNFWKKIEAIMTTGSENTRKMHTEHKATMDFWQNLGYIRKLQENTWICKLQDCSKIIHNTHRINATKVELQEH